MEREQSLDHSWTSQLSPELLGKKISWDQQKQLMSQEVNFESAMSSMVSSPASNPPAVADSAVIGELIGRLGSICNSGEVSPDSRFCSTNNSCYSTPLNSPPKIGLSIPASQMPGVQLSPFGVDPGLFEREVKLCGLYGRNHGGFSGQFGLPEVGKLSRASSSQSLSAQIAVLENGKEMHVFDPVQLDSVVRAKFGSRVSGSKETEIGNGQEVSPVMERMMVGGVERNARKRKANSKGKGKDVVLLSSVANIAKNVAEENSDKKRSKPAESREDEKNAAVKPKAELNCESSEKQEKKNSAKPPEPPKDYIHVRARRGQATDSHSLAERVRREKISERMNFLQDLVPGCNKVTGKAVMLDEIINYVQSLQRQVEFLSMKLATVNPCSDFDAETLLPKENHEVCSSLQQQPLYPTVLTSSAFQYQHQPQGTPLQGVVPSGLNPQLSLNQLESSLHRNLSMQLPTLDGFTDVAPQLGNYWEDDLRSVVQMKFGQSQENRFSSQSFHGN